MKRLLSTVVALAVAVLVSTAGAGVYSLTADGHNKDYVTGDAAYWEDASGANPAYAPGNPNSASDEFAVTDGRLLCGNGYGSSSVQDIYGQRITFGEIGGTAGRFWSETQYETAPVTFHAPAYLANGSFTIAGGAGKCGCIAGKIVVTAPATAPYGFAPQYGNDGNPSRMKWLADFESASDCGLNVSGSKYIDWTFSGDFTDYKGTLDFLITDAVLTFASTTGTIDMKKLTFADRTKLTVDNTTAPLKAETLSFGSGCEVSLSVSVDQSGSEPVFANACLESAALTCNGPVTLKLKSFAVMTESSFSVSLPLVKAPTGSSALNSFTVDASALDPVSFKGTEIVTEGSVQMLVAKFAVTSDNAYYLTADGHNKDNIENAAADSGYFKNLKGENPPYGLFDPNATETDYAVGDNRSMNTGSYYGGDPRNLYFKTLTLGKVGGAAANLWCYSQYVESPVNYNGTMMFANGQFIASGGKGKTGKATGNVVVTAPVTTPFRLSNSYGNAEDPQGFLWDMSFAGAEDVGLAVASGAADKNRNWTFAGDLSGYCGSLDFSVGNTKLTFGADTGATAMNALTLGSNMEVSLENVTAPLSAKTLTVPANIVFNLSAATDGTVVQSASLAYETLVHPDNAKVTLALADFAPPSASVEDQVVRLVLVRAANGGLEQELFELDLGTGSAAAHFKELIVEDGDGQSLVAVFEYAGDASYYLDSKATAGHDVWKNILGETSPTGVLNPESAGTDFAVNGGKYLELGKTTDSDGQTFYGKSIRFGEVGGTAGNLYIDSQYARCYNVFAAPLVLANGFVNFYGSSGNKICRFEATATVTAPASAPFRMLPQGGNQVTEMHLALSGDEGTGLKGDNSKFWMPSFVSDLSAYRGSMDFSNGNVALTFGAETGTIDMKSFAIGYASTVTVENISAPFKAQTLTIADGVVFNLAAAEDRVSPDCSGDNLVTELSSAYEVTNIKVASLEAQTLTLAGSVTLRLADLPKIPKNITSLTLVKAAAGTLDAAKFAVMIDGAGSRHFKGVKVVATAEGDALVAEFDHPGALLIIR